MPFPFTLPTTGHLSFASVLTSSTHPSLPTTATSSRSLLRDTLKRHKRIPAAQQAENLQAVLSALTAYLPYLFALDAGVSNGSVAGEEVEIALVKDVESSWRATLAESRLQMKTGAGGGVGVAGQRMRIKSLEGELAFVLSTLGYTYSLLARAQLKPLYERAGVVLTEERRKSAIAAAMGHLLQAQAVHAYLLSRASGSSHEGGVLEGGKIPDLSPSVFSALAMLALAEATLITVLKDDPYPSVVADERNPNNTDWMYKGVEMPKVRAHLFARLCLAAAEHAGRGLAAVGNTKGVDERLVSYLEDLKATARAKAMRFFAVDAEAQGKIGEGIAWLKGARRELGFAEEEGRVKGLNKLKNSWREKRADRLVEKGGADWGSDAGRFEEGRVLDMLLRKWEKMNDTVNVQTVPAFQPLLSSMPSGREYHHPKPYQVPGLSEEEFTRMRAPPDFSDVRVYGTGGDDADSDDDDDESTAVIPGSQQLPGQFPGTKTDYTSNSSYY